MIEDNILYETQEQKEATKRVLANVRIKKLDTDIDIVVADILKYAKNIDEILAKNKYDKRYLERVNNTELGNVNELYLDDELNDIDFRICEVMEDFLKRINTRIKIIKNNTEIIKRLENSYDLSNNSFDNDLEIAKLRKEDFV